MPETQDILRRFYDNLIKSGKISEQEIGDYDSFRKNISDSTKAQKFYNNLISSNRFTAQDIGTWDHFYGNVKKAIEPTMVKPLGDIDMKPVTGVKVEPVAQPSYDNTPTTAKAIQPQPDWVTSYQNQDLPGPTTFTPKPVTPPDQETIQSIAAPSAGMTPYSPSSMDGVMEQPSPIPETQPITTDTTGKQEMPAQEWDKINKTPNEADTIFKSMLTPQDEQFLKDLTPYGIQPEQLLGPQKQPWFAKEEGRIPFTNKPLPNIFKIGWDESLTSKAYDIIESQAKGIPTGQRLYSLDNPNETEKLIGSVASLLIDSWTFAVPGVGGAIAGAGAGLATYKLLARLGLTKWSQEMVGRLMAEGATEAVASQKVAKGLWLAKEQAAKWGARFGSTSGALAGYNTLREVIDQVLNSGGSFDDMNYQAILKENAIGGSLGLMVAPIGIASEVAGKAIDNRVTNNALKILYNSLVGGSKLLTEAGVFTVGETGLRGEPLSSMTLKQYTDAVITFGILHGVNKATEATSDYFTRSKNFSVAKIGKGPFGVEFTQEERESLAKNGITGSDEQIINQFIDASIQYQTYPKVEKVDPLASPLFKQVMSDPNVTYQTKAKLAWTLGGVKQQFDFNLGSVDVVNENGKWYVDTRTPEGDLVRRDPFNSEPEAQVFAKDVGIVIQDNKNKNLFKNLDPEEKKEILRSLEAKSITFEMIEDSWNVGPKQRAKNQQKVMETLFTEVQRYVDGKSAEQTEQKNAEDYVNRFGFGPAKEYIITVTDKSSGKPRFVVDGDITINPDGTATMGNKPFVVSDETGRKTMVHPNMVSDIAATPSRDYIAKRMSEFQAEQTATKAGMEQVEDIMSQVQEQTSKPVFKNGDKIEIDGKRGEVSDAKNQDDEGITVIFSDGSEIELIKPERYPEISIIDDKPLPKSQGGTGKVVVLETTSGKPVKMDFEEGPDGSIASRQIFTDMTGAKKLVAAFNNTFENLKFTVESIADKADLYAKKQFKIVGRPKIVPPKKEEEKPAVQGITPVTNVPDQTLPENQQPDITPGIQPADGTVDISATELPEAPAVQTGGEQLPVEPIRDLSELEPQPSEAEVQTNQEDVAIEEPIKELTGIDAEVKTMIERLLKQGKITYTDENFKPCAGNGGRDNFTVGGSWAIVKDLKGEPKHSSGGVDIEVNELEVDAEGGELVLKNSFGDYAIIPAKNRLEVQDMVKDRCNHCIDSFVSNLPVMQDYAKFGSIIPEDPLGMANMLMGGDEQYGDQRTWLSNWFQHPEAAQRLIAHGKNPQNYVAFKKTPPYTLAQANEALHGVSSTVRAIPIKSDNKANKYAGKLDQDRNVVIVNDQDPSTAVHELTHASNIVSPFAPFIGTVIQRDTKSQDKYMRAPGEIYSRIMELRFNSGLKPGQWVSPALLEKMKQNTKNLDTGIFDHFQDDTILQLLNGLAQVNTNQNQI